MAEYNFADSPHKFTSPIRFFKANDPYYFEVDNIPLKQLHENDLWIRDQLKSGISVEKVKRADIDELRPYVTGGDNVVHVNPGRFTARINDAYNKTEILQLVLNSGSGIGQIDQWKSNLTTAEYDTILNKFKSEVATDALNLNGLENFKKFWGVVSENEAIDSSEFAEGFVNYPLTDTFFKDGLKTSKIAATIFNGLPTQHPHFVKNWRGVGRTAVVNVDSELTIEIPKFKAKDFQYTDSTGTKVTLTEAEVRIDLLFIYSHPVDTSSTAILKNINHESGTVETITTPTLGIVKGAGAGVSFQKNAAGKNLTLNPTDADGNLQIMGSVADQKNTDHGFSGSSIYGSFPSPDDLMNIAPNLVVGLEKDNLQLVGQTVLPLAYIVVRESAATNAAGNPILTTPDLLDIRPFLRTTELTYNERAGIMAAVPALDFSNPAVGEFQLDYKMQEMKAYVDGQLKNEGSILEPKVVAAGMIWGGKNFGVEGTFTNASAVADYLDLLDVDTNVIPNLPDWDIAPWALGKTNPGKKRNDRIFWNYYGLGGQFAYGAGSQKKIGSENFKGTTLPVQILYCRKTIYFDKSNVDWMAEYSVEVELQNCIPQTNRANVEDTLAAGSPAGIWVERYNDHFVINVSWIADDGAVGVVNSDKLQNHSAFPKGDRDTFGFSGFIVQSGLFELASDGVPKSGIATYPTVSFKVTGYPSGWNGFHNTLHADSPVIVFT